MTYSLLVLILFEQVSLYFPSSISDFNIYIIV